MFLKKKKKERDMPGTWGTQSSSGPPLGILVHQEMSTLWALRHVDQTQCGMACRDRGINDSPSVSELSSQRPCNPSRILAQHHGEEMRANRDT